MDFSNLSGAKVTSQSSARFTFYDLPGEPWVDVHPAGDVNRPYFAAVLAKQSKHRRRLAAGKMNVDMLDDNRSQDRELYPRHVDAGAIGGWRAMNSEGQEEEIGYSPEAFRSICEKLPNDLFDELRAFCNDTANFRSQDDPTDDDVVRTGEN